MGKKNKKLMRPWEPFKKSSFPKEEIIKSIKLLEESDKPQEVKEKAISSLKSLFDKEVWKNNYYEVVVSKVEGEKENQLTIIHLSIKRLDKKASKDWRHFQRIKNELIGEEYEAVELYPQENRLVDMANQYHLWAFKNSDGTPFIFPFGFQERLTNTEDYDDLELFKNAKQRKQDP